MKYQETCECCGTVLTAYTQPFNKSMANALIALVEAYDRLRRPINLGNDLNLTHSQQCNLPKLRYYGLIQLIKKGEWIPTGLGVEFCKERAQIYFPAATLGNRILPPNHQAWQTHQVVRRNIFISEITDLRYKQTEEYAAEKSGQAGLGL